MPAHVRRNFYPHRRKLQEPSFIIVMSLAVVAMTAGFMAFRLVKSRWHHKNRKADSIRGSTIPAIRVVTPPTPPSNSTSGLENTPSSPKSDMVAEQLRNEQHPIAPITIPSSSDSTISTSIEQEPESSITENAPAESAAEVPVAIDNVIAVQETYNDEPVLPNVHTKISPEKRGGGRSEQRKTETAKRQTSSEKSQRSRKPEAICWQRSRKWFLGIEILDENADSSQLTVTQGSNPLRAETNTRWILSNIDGNVNVSSPLSSESFELTLAQKETPFLLFKLSGQNLTQGRRIRYATSGTYLVVTPENWVRNEELSGISQVPPALCHLNGYKAHLFYLDSETDNCIAFLTSERKPIEVPNRRSEFDLVGSSIEDASETMGPLFGNEPPRIRSRSTEGWKNVAIVVIGEEGERRGGWRTSFDPAKDSDTQDLSLLLSGKQVGWYFVRIYDVSEGAPIESFDFRFVMDLKTITISQHDVMPGEDGHKPVRIDLKWSGDTPCELIPNHSRDLSIDTNHTCTSIEIPPDPDCDKTEWTLRLSTSSRVAISLLVERVWWSICNQNTSSEHISWKDKPVVIQRNHLVASSEHLLRVRFPRRRWTRKVHVGFEQRRTREYPVEVTKLVVDIPLNEFEGMVELENSGEDRPLKLWINGYPEQTVAVLSKSARAVRPKRSKAIKLNMKRLLNYLNRLERATRDAPLSDMLNECKGRWRLAGVKEQRDAYSLQTACVIMLCWRVIRGKGMKPIGRRKGWVRSLVKLAEANPAHLAASSKQYETLRTNSKPTRI